MCEHKVKWGGWSQLWIWVLKKHSFMNGSNPKKGLFFKKIISSTNVN
jgi:hypothetical protein